MISLLTSFARADDPPMVHATEVVVSADRFYVNARFVRQVCIVQRETRPLPAVPAPTFPRPTETDAPRRGHRWLRVDTWYANDNGGAGIVTTVLRIRHGSIEGDLALLEQRLFPYCDLGLLSEEVIAEMTRSGAHAARALLAAAAR